MNTDYTLLVVSDQGVIESMAFGGWVSKTEAVKTIQELYPEAIAVLDRLTYQPIWSDRWVSFS